ncbi:hypothetical protein HID58_026406, partial [Brassica napus]
PERFYSPLTLILIDHVKAFRSSFSAVGMTPIFFSDLKSSKCSYVVEPRLLRFWDARNVKCGDLYSIIDEACWAVDLVSLSGQVTWGSPSNPNSARSKNLRSSPLFVRPP